MRGILALGSLVIHEKDLFPRVMIESGLGFEGSSMGHWAILPVVMETHNPSFQAKRKLPRDEQYSTVQSVVSHPDHRCWSPRC